MIHSIGGERDFRGSLQMMFDRIVRQHVEAYCLVVALLSIATLAVVH